MVLIDARWNMAQNVQELTYLANTAADIDVSALSPTCAIGSAILVVGDGSMYIKNTDGAWQKSGSTEVLA